MDGATALSILASLITILSKVGTGPVVTIIIAIVVGPWLFSVSMAWVQSRRVDAMRKMYENNVKLVECYESLAKQQNDVVTLNTAKWAEVETKIDANQFCPMVRVKKERVEDKF